MSKDLDKNEMVIEGSASEGTSNRYDQAIAGEYMEEGQASQSMSAIAKIINIIVAPTAALKAIRERPTVLLAMIVVPLFSLLYYVLFWNSYEVQIIRMLEAQFAAQGIELTREMLELQLTIQRWTAPIGSFIGTYVAVAFAGLFYFAAGRFMKKEVTYKQVFSMLIHASVVSSLLWLVHMLITVIAGESNILAPMTSVSSLLPAQMDGTLVSYLLAPVEIFTLWYMYLLYLGLNIVCDYSKKASGIAVAITFAISVIMSSVTYIMSSIG